MHTVFASHNEHIRAYETTDGGHKAVQSVGSLDDGLDTHRPHLISSLAGCRDGHDLRFQTSQANGIEKLDSRRNRRIDDQKVRRLQIKEMNSFVSRGRSQDGQIL